MNIYVDCPHCDGEILFKVTLDRCCGNVLEVDLEQRFCKCEITAGEWDELENQAADKYDIADEGDDYDFY